MSAPAAALAPEKKEMPAVFHDLLASVVVFLVALPLCMGIAIASGMPPAVGVITGVIGGIVVGALSGSPLQVSGPAAGLVVLVWEIVRDFGIESLGVIIAIAGVVQVVGGVFGVGRWFRAISPAVVNGMLAGIGILIFASQFHVMVDDSPKTSGLQNLFSIPGAIYKGVFPVDGSSHHIAAMVGLVTIGTMIAWNRFRPKALSLVPGPLVGVVVATALDAFLNLPIKNVDLPDNLFDTVRFLSPVSLSAALKPGILFAALGVAFVASAESLLSAVAVDRMHTGPRTNFNRELFAQGVGNLTSGLVGGLPLTGVIVRSSANVNAGARSRLSAMAHGVWLLMLVATLPWALEKIPIAALAAVLVHTGLKLISIEKAKQILAYGRMPFAIYVATVATIVAKDLLTGVLVGIALSVAKLLFKVTRLWIRVEDGATPGRTDVYLEGTATFVRLPSLAHALEAIPAGTEVHLHIQRLLYIDHSCMDLLRSWEKQQAEFGTRLVVEWEELNQRYHAPMELRAA